MELLTPETGLLLWTLLPLLYLFLSVIALLKISREEFKDTNGKLIWTLIVLLLPLAGPVLYFLICKNTQVNSK
jgi:hypothetical protein